MDIRKMAKFAMHNKEQLIGAENCGCYHCMTLFQPKEIKEWTDNGTTAICPNCNVDAVLADGPDLQMDKDVLMKINKYWF